jgi:2'-5' RNA ligase
MAYAVTLPLPDKASTIIAGWQQALAHYADNPPEMTGYAPHISVAVCDGRPVDATVAVLDRLAMTLKPITVAFSGPALFAGAENTLYAAVVPTTELLDHHHAVYNSLHAVAVHPHYTPGRWVPHCTLAMNIDRDRLGAALAVAAEGWRPLSATLDRLELVTFPPVDVIVSSPVAGH